MSALMLYYNHKGKGKWKERSSFKIPNTRKEKLMFDNSFIVENEIALDFYVVAPNGELVKWDA